MSNNNEGSEAERSMHDPAQSADDALSPQVNLVYKLEGEPNAVNVFDLSQVLNGLGVIVREASRIINLEPGDIVLSVMPFKEGSFWMDLIATVGPPVGLVFMTNPDIIQHIRLVYQSLGLIPKGVKVLNTVLDVVRFLKEGKPTRIEQIDPEKVRYENNDGELMVVNINIHKMVVNGNIQNNLYNAVGRPLERPGITGLKTFIPNEPNCITETSKDDVAAIRAFSQPKISPPAEEVIENTTTAFLHPKSGTYGETTGEWTFRIAGTKRTLKAKITDQEFLAKYENGLIRFCQNDLLKVQLLERQTIHGTTGHVKNEITKIYEYRKAELS